MARPPENPSGDEGSKRQRKSVSPDAPTAIRPSSSSAPARRAVGSSTTSKDDSPEVVIEVDGEPGHVPTEEQRTVISKQPPLVESRFRYGVKPQELGAMLEGELLGHFRLDEFVGGGGMGAVFRASDTMLGRTVAVKVLSRDQTDTETLRRFQNEAQSAARLDHENIARVYYVGEDKGVNYIVFEFIEGVNVRDLVDYKGPLSLEEAINYVLQVAGALDHAHQRDVVHRDIKPSNILVTPDGRAKLVDMGLARLHHMESTSEDITASGVTLGTFDYISPEQARDPRCADVRSDIYSLGCTMYFILTAQAPFPEGTVLQKLLSHSTDDPPDPRRYRADVDERTSRILAKMMAKQPADRYQHPNDLITDLVKLADSLGLDPGRRVQEVSLPKTSSTSYQVQRHLPWLVPVLILMVTVTCLSFFWNPPAQSETFQVVLPKPLDLPIRTEAAAGADDSSGARTDGASREAASGDGASRDAAPGDGATGGGATGGGVGVESSGRSGTADGGENEGGSGGPAADGRAASGEGSPPSGSGRDTGGDSLPRTDPPTDDGAQRRDGTGIAAGDSTEAAPEVRGAAAAGDPASDRSVDPARSPDADAGPEDVRIVVVGDVEPPGPYVNVVPTLAMAVRQALASESVDQIELHFDGVREELPLDIVADDITIRAGRGYKPEIAFRPNVDDFGGGTTAMVNVVGGSLHWRNVHLRFDVPAEWVDTWSLFQLREVRRLEFSDCVLTIRNVHEDGSVYHDRVSFLEFSPTVSMPSDSMDPDPVEPPRPEIRLERCIARGQATLIRADRGTAFWLIWDEGLFASTERLLEGRGMAGSPTAEQRRINLDMENVTALARKGICRMWSGDQSPRHAEVTSNWTNSIVITDSDAPLYELVGPEGTGARPVAEELVSRTGIRGRDNLYPNSEIVLRARSGTEVIDYAADQRRNFDRWYDEMGTEYGVRIMWKGSATARLSVDQRTKYDYVPELPAGGSPNFRPGFSLPDLPEVGAENAKGKTSSDGAPAPEKRS